MKEEKKKYTFFHKFIDSIKNIEKYPELAIKSYGEVLLYMVKLLLIFALIVTIAYTFKISKEIKNITDFISDEIPNFELEEGKLYIDSEDAIIKENVSENLNIVIIDTNNNLEESSIEKYKNELLNKENGIVLLKDKFLIKTMMTDGVIEYKYSTVTEMAGINNVTKLDFVEYFTGKSIVLMYVSIFITTFIYIFIFYSISIFLDVILLTILGYISTLFLRMRIRINALSKISIHSLTLSIVLSLIVILIELFTPFKVKYFEIMYLVVAYIYVVATISIIRVDIIKNKEELMNIIEEQKRVKEELDRQEEQKREQEKNKEEQEKENEQSKEENKDNTKKEEKDGEDDAPQEEGT